jgi:hypothetical protein
MAKQATATKPTSGKTAAATNIADILDKPSNEAKRPPPMPIGSYISTVKGLPRFDKSSKKQTPYVEFLCAPTAVGEDVDEAALAEIGGLADKTIKCTFYLTEASEYRLKEFLDACQIADVDEDGDPLSHRQRIDMSPNCQVGIYMIHEPADDGVRTFAKPGSFFLVE